MGKPKDSSAKAGMATGLMLAGAVLVLALPSAVLAFSSRFEAIEAGDAVLPRVTNASNNGSLAMAVPVRSSLAQGHPFRFTPAGKPSRPNRSVTVAIRVDQQTAETITVRGISLAAARPSIAAVQGVAPLRISPTAFNLGVSRGYQNFAAEKAKNLDIRKIEMPDLASFKPARGAPAGDAKFAPRISLDEKQTTGRAPRTFADAEDRVDVGGALRVTKNLDVTAGVRYSQERDRLRSVTDGKQDNQAVYVGTQFRF